MVICISRPKTNALLAQLDRVFGYEPKGQGFESLAARHNKRTSERVSFCYATINCGDSKPEGARSVKQNSLNDCFAAKWCEEKARSFFEQRGCEAALSIAARHNKKEYRKVLLFVC